VGQLSDQWLDGDPESHIILQAGLSSIYNAEKILFRLKDALEKIRHKSVHGLPLTDEDIKMIQKQLGTFADESRYIQNGDEIKTMQSQNFITLYSKLELLLSQIEEMSVDSKLDALINHLQSYFEFEVEGTPYLCVYTSFLNTAQYINSSLRAQGWGVSIYSLTSALLPDERMRRIQEFRKSGGIIIVTDSALKGVTIDYVDYCINYDLPLNPMIFYIRSTRFLRAKNEFRMAVLKDRSEVLAWEKFLEGSYTSDCCNCKVSREQRKARTGKNSQTGAKLKIKASKTVGF
jgi:superfamily II DNA/RNA helicase